MPRQGYIYAAVSISSGTVKIGYTTGFVKRASQIQHHSPSPIFFVILQEGTEEDERRLHNKFSEWRDHGEWFSLAAEVGDFIRKKVLEAYEARRIVSFYNGSKEPYGWSWLAHGEWKKPPFIFRLLSSINDEYGFAYWGDDSWIGHGPEKWVRTKSLSVWREAECMREIEYALHLADEYHCAPDKIVDAFANYLELQKSKSYVETYKRIADAINVISKKELEFKRLMLHVEDGNKEKRDATLRYFAYIDIALKQAREAEQEEIQKLERPNS